MPINQFTPYFSIIIPCYNCSEYIHETVNSTLNQTGFDDFEILLINDGSTDNTEEILRSLAKDNSKIHVFSISNSGGPAKPRNIGIEKSKGRWICFLDSDDLFSPSKLKTIYANCNSSDHDIIVHHCQKITPKGERLNQIIGKGYRKFNVYNLLTRGNRYVLSSITIKKTSLSNIRFDEDLKYSGVEDYKFLIACASLKLKLFRFKKILGYYRVCPHSLSSSPSQFRKILDVLEEESTSRGFGESKAIEQIKIYYKLHIDRKSITFGLIFSHFKFDTLFLKNIKLKLKI